ncbi:MAG: hypothetical protein ACFFEV_07415, partial [Candidatus Thorarchaeota archaeon]
MSQILKQNKFFLSALVITIVLTGMTFGNIPTPPIPQGIQTVNGTTFNFTDYSALTHEQIGIINFFNRLIMDQPINLWEDWNAEAYMWA